MLGVKFDGKHSGADYGLIMNYARPESPKVKNEYITVPGRSGDIDLTEALGDVQYEDIEISFKFTYIGLSRDKQKKFINENLGQKRKIILDKDKDYYYLGRLLTAEPHTEGNLTIIEVTARCSPYKYKIKETVHREIIQGENSIILKNDRKSVIPTIEVSGDMTLEFQNVKYILKTGRYKIPEILLVAGYNRFKIMGQGIVTFVYQEGCL